MTFIEPGPQPDPAANPPPVRRVDPLAAGGNWWELPPLAPHELEVPASPHAAVPPVAFGDPNFPAASAPVVPGYQQPGYAGPPRFSALQPRVGSSEALVAAAPKRSMDQNELGQNSLLIGIGLSLLFLLTIFIHVNYVDMVLFAVAALGAGLGVRGYNAANRGLATNRGSSIAGIVLAVTFFVAEIVVYIVRLSEVAQQFPGQ